VREKRKQEAENKKGTEAKKRAGSRDLENARKRSGSKPTLI